MTTLLAKNKKYIILLVLFGLVLLTFVPYYTGTDEMESCIFCDIAAGKKNETKIEVETNDYVIFKDIKPASTHHYLAVTKRHIESLQKLTKNDDVLVLKMEDGLKKFFQSKGIDTKDALFGFHLPPFITVKHLHMHGIAPQSKMGFVQRLVFKPGTFWFKTVSDAREYIKKREL